MATHTRGHAHKRPSTLAHVLVHVQSWPDLLWRQMAGHAALGKSPRTEHGSDASTGTQAACAYMVPKMPQLRMRPRLTCPHPTGSLPCSTASTCLRRVHAQRRQPNPVQEQGAGGQGRRHWRPWCLGRRSGRPRCRPTFIWLRRRRGSAWSGRRRCLRPTWRTTCPQPPAARMQVGPLAVLLHSWLGRTDGLRARPPPSAAPPPVCAALVLQGGKAAALARNLGVGATGAAVKGALYRLALACSQGWCRARPRPCRSRCCSNPRRQQRLTRPCSCWMATHR